MNTNNGDAGNKNKIIFNYEKCVGCGICSKVCGSSVIKMNNKLPQIGYNQLCCCCGHCAAICPRQAISSNDTDNYRSFKIKELQAEDSSIEMLLKNKRSVREFKDEVLCKDNIEKIIRYAEKAPSSTNNRHRKYIVVTDKDKIAEIEKAVICYFTRLGKIINPLLISFVGVFSKNLSNDLATIKADIEYMKNSYAIGENPIFKNAPALIFITAPKKDIQAKDDCIIAQQYMMLYAESLGIGSCINGYAQFANKKIAKLLAIKSSHAIFSAGIFGYSKYTYKNEIIYNNNSEIFWM